LSCGTSFQHGNACGGCARTATRTRRFCMRRRRRCRNRRQCTFARAANAPLLPPDWRHCITTARAATRTRLCCAQSLRCVRSLACAASAAAATAVTCPLHTHSHTMHARPLFSSSADSVANRYMVEQTLSVDNLFVFLLLFEYFKVPIKFQSRVLQYGIFGAVSNAPVFKPALCTCSSWLQRRRVCFLSYFSVFAG
jgi:Integral membrane protein TerC family